MIQCSNACSEGQCCRIVAELLERLRMAFERS